MKKILTLLFFAALSSKAGAQAISISETFNSNCAVLGENYPANWSEYDIFSNPTIAWTCAPTEGRGTSSTLSSPGIMVTNYDGVNFYLDTAWLFTPQLNLSFYTGNIYLQFDSKYDLADGRYSLLVSNDYQGGWNPDTVLGTHIWYDATSAITPVLGNIGTSDWVTYVIDLTAFKSAPMYVAFRYTSGAAEQSTWVIDNVYTTQTPTGIGTVNQNALSLVVVGNSTPDLVTLAYNVSEAATYQLRMYDMMGRIVYEQSINAQPGAARLAISGLDLPAGMYLIKIGDGLTYSTAKVMIR